MDRRSRAGTWISEVGVSRLAGPDWSISSRAISLPQGLAMPVPAMEKRDPKNQIEGGPQCTLV